MKWWKLVYGFTCTPDMTKVSLRVHLLVRSFRCIQMPSIYLCRLPHNRFTGVTLGQGAFEKLNAPQDLF